MFEMIPALDGPADNVFDFPDVLDASGSAGPHDVTGDSP